MSRAIVAALLAGACCAGCRLYLWAGSHELTIPPGAEPTATPAVPPALVTTPSGVY
jgi:hypothetical protein